MRANNTHKPNIYNIIAWRNLSTTKRNERADRLAGHPRRQAPGLF